MKKRMIVIVVAFLAIAVTALVQIGPGNFNARVHQHEIAGVTDADMEHPLVSISQTDTSQTQYDADAVDVSSLQTHLPIVILHTGEEIPGVPYYSEDTSSLLYTVAEDEGPYLLADMQIIDNKTSVNSIGDLPSLISNIQIKVRGNTSRWFDKKSYSVKLIDSNNVSDNQPIMGMEAHNDWALHGPFLDKTLIRNYMAMNIAGELMGYAPDVRFCEVILNGEYQGLYIMMETIDRGAGRIDINKPSADGRANTGYIIELNSKSVLPPAVLNNFTKYTSVLRDKSYFEIAYPGTASLTPALQDYIERDVSAFEKALYSFDYNTKSYGYQNYIDVGEFINYAILIEVFLQYDTGGLSTFFYKDSCGLYRPCVWDFNNSLENISAAAESHSPVSQFVTIQSPWFSMLIKDEAYIERMISQYYRLRKGILSDEYVSAYIADTTAYLGHAIDRNYAVWGYSFDVNNVNENNRFSPSSRNPTSYEDALQRMEETLLDRLAWLDENIVVLRQYAHESAVKKYNH